MVMGWRTFRLAKSAWYHWKLPGTSRTPMIVQVRFVRMVSAVSWRWCRARTNRRAQLFKPRQQGALRLPGGGRGVQLQAACFPAHLGKRLRGVFERAFALLVVGERGADAGIKHGASCLSFVRDPMLPDASTLQTVSASFPHLRVSRSPASSDSGK